MENSTLKYGVIIAIMVLVFSGIYFLVKELNKNESLEYDEYLKNYKVNEYIPMYVSDEDMAKIYLNDYVYNMFNDVETAYNSLEESYRNKTFNTLESYINYVNNLNYTSYNLDNYYIKNIDGYKVFAVNDTNGNFYAFKTKGVMEYTVSLINYE